MNSDKLYGFSKISRAKNDAEKLYKSLVYIVEHPARDGEYVTRCKNCRKCYTEHEKTMCDLHGCETSEKDYCSRAEHLRESICWGCANATDGRKCSWARNLTPVEGWKALRVIKSSNDGDAVTYEVRECPNYVYDGKYYESDDEDDDEVQESKDGY